MILRKFFALAALLLLAFALSCSGDNSNNNSGSGDSSSSSGGTSGGEDDPPIYIIDPDRDDLGLDSAIIIKFENGTPVIDNPSEGNVVVSSNGGHVIVTVNTSTEYNLIVSGATSNGSVKIYGQPSINMGLYLRGVDITNPTGPAINIQRGGRILVHLVENTLNKLADGANYGPTGGEDAKGTFFSERKLRFQGTGSLEIRSKYNHAIAVDNDIDIEYGKITVIESKNDCIHANDKIHITGGTLNLTCEGDAIQNEALPIRISGGRITAKTSGIKSHGIISADSLIISEEAIIDIVARGNGSKGMRADGPILINGGDTKIETHGGVHIDNSVSPPDTNSSTGIKARNDIEIRKGKLKVVSTGTRIKGINTDGDFKMSDGDLNIEATDDGIKVHGDLSITGGKVTIKARDGIDCNNACYLGLNATVNITDRNSQGGF
ncbi:MAG: carbohydrate-binding domain-containing protein [Fibromonadaceae bacterium]|nr:carbohydrate-binding domain-containing protein [Fibromonadaceae bacterium]